METEYKPQELIKPSNKELYDDDQASYGPDPALSSGMSFEQIGEAVNVLTEPDSDEDKKMRAAKTLYDLQNTEIFDFITKEVSNTIAIENLLRDYLDGNGEPLRKRGVNIEDFNMQNYV